MTAERLDNETLLVQQMQAGSEQAFTTLYRYYSPRLYLNILRMIHDPLLAEEMVQELFTRIWQNRTNKGIQEEFTGYMYRIGQNLVHDFFRKVQRDRRLKERFISIAGEHYENVEEALQFQESSAILQKAIAQLSPQQKKVYTLVKVEGYTYKKAAGIMGISPLTVKEYLVSTNKSIRKYVIQHMDAVIIAFIFLGITIL